MWGVSYPPYPIREREDSYKEQLGWGGLPTHPDREREYFNPTNDGHDADPSFFSRLKPADQSKHMLSKKLHPIFAERRAVSCFLMRNLTHW